MSMALRLQMLSTDICLKGTVLPSLTLLDQSPPQAALALYHVVTKLRSEEVSFMRWVPLVHLAR